MNNEMIENMSMGLEDKKLNPVVLQQKPKPPIIHSSKQSKNFWGGDMGDMFRCDECGEWGHCEIVNLEYKGNDESVWDEYVCKPCRDTLDIAMCETCPHLLWVGWMDNGMPYMDSDGMDIIQLGWASEEGGTYCPSCVNDGTCAKKERKCRTTKKIFELSYDTDWCFEWIDRLA